MTVFPIGLLQRAADHLVYGFNQRANLESVSEEQKGRPTHG